MPQVTTFIYGVREFGYDCYRQRYRPARRFPAVHPPPSHVRQYARNAVRGSVEQQRQVMVYTHDSSVWAKMARRTSGRAGGASARNAEHVHMASVRPVESAVAWEIWRRASDGPPR